MSNVHESVYQSYHILEAVEDRLKRGDSVESVLELIEWARMEHAAEVVRPDTLSEQFARMWAEGSHPLQKEPQGEAEPPKEIDEAEQRRRISKSRVVEFAPQALVQMCKVTAWPRWVAEGLPDDAEVLGSHWDEHDHTFRILVFSESFMQIPADEVALPFVPVFHAAPFKPMTDPCMGGIHGKAGGEGRPPSK